MKMKGCFVIAVLAILVLSIPAVAAIITTSDDSVYDLLNAEFSTGDLSNSAYSQATSHSVTQTITTGAEGLDLQSIHIVYYMSAGTSDATLTLNIFDVADTYAATIVPGTTLLTETFTVPSSDGKRWLLSIELDSTLSLAANTGYAFDLETSDASATEIFKWRRSGSTTGDFYAGGAFYDDDAIKSSGTRDGLLALNGVVPEPATLSLMAFGGIALLKRKRS